MPRAEIDAQGVLNAIAEFDSLGRSTFLDRYGFNGSRDYFLVYEGHRYDSKAIAAVAHKWAPLGDGRALTPLELSGGKTDAAKRLRELGFEVTEPVPNGDWSWNEHILALDLYMSNPSHPSRDSDEVRALSALLNELGAQTSTARNETFRNPNGVYMKLMNFRRFDPAFQSQGKVGLTRGSRGEEKVWRAYANNRDALRGVAAEIRASVGTETEATTAFVRERAKPWGGPSGESGAVFSGRQRSIIEMRASIENTVRQANGQTVERTLKNKDLRMARGELDHLLDQLLDQQGNCCALTGIPFHFHGDQADRHRLPSPDRIDSSGHYEASNLQLVCQFVNFWKRDTEIEEFKRLLALVRA